MGDEVDSIRLEKYHNIGLVSGDSAYEKRNRLKINTINGILGKDGNNKKLKIPTPKTLKILHAEGFDLEHLYSLVDLARTYNELDEKTDETRKEMVKGLHEYLSPSQEILSSPFNPAIGILDYYQEQLDKQETYESLQVNPILLLGSKYNVRAEDIPYIQSIKISQHKLGDNEYTTMVTEPSSKETLLFKNQTDLGLQEAYKLVIDHRINHINAQISQGKKALERAIDELDNTIDMVQENDADGLLKNIKALRLAIKRKKENHEGFVEEVTEAKRELSLHDGPLESILAHKKEVNNFSIISDFAENILPELESLHDDLIVYNASFSASQKEELKAEIDKKSAALDAVLQDKISEMRMARYNDDALFAVIKKDELYHLCFKVSKHKVPTLKTFETKEEAENYLSIPSLEEKSRRFVEISRIIEEMSGKPLMRPRDNDVHSRIGEDYTKGQNVSQEALLELGAAGIEYGVTTLAKEGEARMKINMLYDSLRDMAKVLQMETRDLLLAKGLSISLGGRGIGGRNAPKAHIEYTSPFPVINLTRHSGDGSLAHELIHGLDFHTNNIIKSNPKHGEIEKRFLENKQSLFEALKKTDMYAYSEKKDSFKKKDYWSTDHEMLARAGESWVLSKIEEKGESNGFLVAIESSGVYPSKKDKKEIFPKIENFMKSVAEISKAHNPSIAIENQLIIDANAPKKEEVINPTSKQEVDLFSAPMSQGY